MTDGNGCVGSAQVTITEPAAIQITPGSINASCGIANGKGYVNVTGGTMPYSYTWYDHTFTTPISGQTTDTLFNAAADTFYVVVTDANFCSDYDTVIVHQNCAITLDLTAFIEGYYSGGTMTSPLYNSGVGIDPNNVDSITVVLYDQFDPTIEIARAQAILHANGTAMAIYPHSIIGGSYYLAILTRNSVETWSKLPVTFGAITNFDFAH